MSEHSQTAAAILAAGHKAPEIEPERQETYLHQAMEDFHRAAKTDTPSYAAMASAFRAAFDILDSEPDSEPNAEAE